MNDTDTMATGFRGGTDFIEHLDIGIGFYI